MLYTELIKKAAEVAYQAHNGQKDKGGLPYFLHPMHLAQQMVDEDTTVVALLHDVLEDTALTAQELYKNGFSVKQVEAVQALTRPDGMDYMEYVARLKDNPVAVRVKQADLKHNADISRIPNPVLRDYSRAEKYKNALHYLDQCAV